MTQPLFYKPEYLDKTAGEVDLSDDPNQWAQQILQELYKQVPYITDYQPHVTMARVDAERGYGMGHVEIQNQTEAPDTAPQAQLDAAGIRSVRIPFVIREKKLCPFDLLINDTGAIIPLTERRMKQSLFRPQAFDVTSRTPGDQSLIGQLYPPQRQDQGFVGGGGMGAAKTGSVLDAILTTLDSYDRDRLATEVGRVGEEILTRQKIASSRFVSAVDALLSEWDTVKEASWENWLKADVVQVQKTDNGYLLKTACSGYWDPKVAYVSRGDVVRTYGAKVALEADLSGSCTMASGMRKVAKEEAHGTPAPISKPGAYKVRDTTGAEHVGYVVPQLIGVTGEPVSLSLFTNGSVVAVQGDMQGVPAGDISLPSGPIGKTGAFYTADGAVRMTVPLDLQDSISFGDQPRVYRGTSFDGTPVEVALHPNITDVTPVDSNRILIPASWQWLPLDGADSISLSSPEVTTAADLSSKLSHVEVLSDGTSFTFRGVPLTKVASDSRSFLGLDDSLFLLAGLGVNLDYGIEKLAECVALRKPVSIKISRVIDLKSDLMGKAMGKAASLVKQAAALRQPILLKEAASFPDPQMVDTVLSLGFINPQNITTFVSYLPDIEEVQTKLCEILFSVRLGLSNVPQSALERAVRSIEEVIEGLKVLGFQGS